MPASGCPGPPLLPVDSVVGPDDEDDGGVGEIVVDLIHLEHDAVGHLGLGHQHVHVAGESAGDLVDTEPHVSHVTATEARVRASHPQPRI